MTPEELNALADRVERLEGADYEIELEIATWCYDNGGIAGVTYDPAMWLERNGGGFTYSIEAALTLVPEGYDWSLDNFDGEFGKPSAWVHARRSAAEIVPVTGSTPALAICGAALRARAALASENSNAE